MSNSIEVYEWKKGAPRPGTTEKHRHTCIDHLAIPPGGQVPQQGDVILLNDAYGPDPFAFKRYRVIERELMWSRIPKENDDGQTPVAWSKMWIQVRLLDDETK